MRLRLAQPTDLPKMQQLYVDTIKSVCTQDYNSAQIAVWTATAANTPRWIKVLENQLVIIAEKNRQMVGYGTLDKGNYIDFFYIHKDFQRRGIARKILSQIETHARCTGNTHLTSDVSITAKPFFEKNGFEVVCEQKNVRHGVELINFKMHKML